MTTALTSTPKRLSSVALKAQQIRADFKANGIKARVQSRNFSMGCSIDIQVLSGNFPLAVALAEKQENVSRCSLTGDILSGGNTYVHTTADSRYVDAVRAPINDAVARAFALVSHPDRTNAIERVEGTDYRLEWNLTGKCGEVRNGRCVGRFCNLDGAQRAVASAMIEAGVK